MDPSIGDGGSVVRMVSLRQESGRPIELGGTLPEGAQAIYTVHAYSIGLPTAVWQKRALWVNLLCRYTFNR